MYHAILEHFSIVATRSNAVFVVPAHPSTHYALCCGARAGLRHRGLTWASTASISPKPKGQNAIVPDPFTDDACLGM